MTRNLALSWRKPVNTVTSKETDDAIVSPASALSMEGRYGDGKKKLELYKTFLKSPDADQNQKELLKLEVSGHERHIRMYADLIREATSPKT